MVWGLKKKQLPWKLAYIFIYQGTTVSIYERFTHKAQAEQHFTVRRRHHARLLQPIVQGPPQWTRRLSKGFVAGCAGKGMAPLVTVMAALSCLLSIELLV